MEDVRALFPSRGAYRRFVEEGIGENSLWAGLRGQIYLGREDFLKRIRRRYISCGARQICRSPRWRSAWISVPRVSQIQAEIEKGKMTETFKGLLESYSERPDPPAFGTPLLRPG